MDGDNPISEGKEVGDISSTEVPVSEAAEPVTVEPEPQLAAPEMTAEQGTTEQSAAEPAEAAEPVAAEPEPVVAEPVAEPESAAEQGVTEQVPVAELVAEPADEPAIASVTAAIPERVSEQTATEASDSPRVTETSQDIDSMMVDFTDPPSATELADPSSLSFTPSVVDGEQKPLTIEVSGLVANDESPVSGSPISRSGNSEASRDDSQFAIEVLADPGEERTHLDKAVKNFVSSVDVQQFIERLNGIQEHYVQVLNVAKDYLFAPMMKNPSNFKIDSKSARGIALFNLGSELAALQTFHSDLPQTWPGLVEGLNSSEFVVLYLKYAQEFRAGMDHVQDQAKKNKAFQALIDGQFPPNMDEIEEYETLFCIFFHPILHISQLQFVFFQIFQSTDPSTAIFPQLEKLVGVLWQLKGLLLQELKFLSQDDSQNERKNLIAKTLERERRTIFGIEVADLPRISISLYASPIPTVLLGLTEVLCQNQGFRAKGLFRIAPSADDSDRAYERIGDGDDSADVTKDVFVASNLIKIWFRELPVPLFQKIDFSKVTDDSSEEEAGAMIMALPEPERSLALWVLDLCCAVMLEVEINAMNSKNLAIVFAPNVSPKIVGDPMSEMKLTRKCEQLLTNAIEWRAKANIKFELPSRDSRNRRPATTAALPTLGELQVLDPKSELPRPHSIFSVASFKAHLKGDNRDTMKRSPSTAELPAKKASAKSGRTTTRSAGKAVVLTTCASCACEIPEGESCLACEGDLEATDDDTGTKKSRFGIFGSKKSSRSNSKSPANVERKSPPPPPTIPATLNVAPALRTTPDKTPGSASNSARIPPPPPQPQTIPATGESVDASKPDDGSEKGHRHQSSADLASGRLRPKDADVPAVWKKSSLRVETIGINVQALMSQVATKPREQVRADLQALLTELDASKAKVQAEIATLDAQ